MKRIIYILATGFVFCLAATACSTVKKSNTMQQQRNSIKGTVTQIQRGKDGYTATIKTADGHYYYATISRANLSDPAQYRETAIGEQIDVTGDPWNSGTEEHITVRVLRARP